MEAVLQFLKERDDAWEKLRAFGAKFGATGYYGTERGISSVEIETGECPDGWRPVKGMWRYFTPRATTKEGKELKKEMRALGVPNSGRLEELLGAGWGAYIVGLTIYHVGLEKVGDALILTVPNCNKKWPTDDPGCIPLKTSEYWALKEAIST